LDYGDRLGKDGVPIMAFFTISGEFLTDGSGNFATDSACCCGASPYCSSKAACYTKIGTGTALAKTTIACPSMKLRVTGPDNTNWCGKAWVMPGDDGKCLEACPDAYHLIKHTYTYSYVFSYYPYTSTISEKRQILKEMWSHTKSVNDWGLKLMRYRLHITNLIDSCENFRSTNLISLLVGANAAADQTDYWRYYSWYGPGGCFTSQDGDLVAYDLHKIFNHTTGTARSFIGNQVVPTDYKLTSLQFSSCPCTTTTPSSCSNSGVTVGNNTFFWEKGNDWP
jgi:hypothetical protein